MLSLDTIGSQIYNIDAVHRLNVNWRDVKSHAHDIVSLSLETMNP